MLNKVYIKNFALLEELEISFSPGFNVLTGETGAGKTLVINALNSILGEKVSTDILRTGEEKVIVEGTFSGSSKDIYLFLKENEIDILEDEILLRRELNKSGRSRTFVNDNLTQINLLKNISNQLVDLHGQHDHQSLIREESHIQYVDIFGSLEDEKDKVKKLFSELVKLNNKKEYILKNAQQLSEKKDFLQFQLNEIESLKLASNEEEELEKEEKILQNYEKLVENCNSIYSVLYEDENAVFSSLGNVNQFLQNLIQIDSNFSEQIKQISEAYINVEEVARFVNDYISKTEFDPDRLEQIRSRLNQISQIKKKYGLPIDKIIEKNEQNKTEIEQIENLDEDQKQIEKKINKTKIVLKSASKALSEFRKKTSKELEKLILIELKQIGMENAQFKIHFGFFIEKGDGSIRLDSGTIVKSNGQDKVEFLVSTNPGEDFKPLAKIASGGELSRIMLAIKSVLAEKDQIDVLVFDEIDIGISGRIAEAVGRKMKELSKSHQIICVTHLPQIAGFADKHFSVRKEVKNGETFAFIHELDAKARIRELAYLLGGEKITDVVLKNAQELLESSVVD